MGEGHKVVVVLRRGRKEPVEVTEWGRWPPGSLCPDPYVNLGSFDGGTDQSWQEEPGRKEEPIERG